MASPSTLGRLERTKADATAASRYEKIVIDFEAVEVLFLILFIERYEGRQPPRIVIDLVPRTSSCMAKAEHLDKGENPRFVVTSLAAREFEKRYLYEELYCARGEMENQIKEQQLDLFGDRASCHTFRGNHIRLWCSMAAQWLTVTVRTVGLAGTELARAQAQTIRNKLFKIGAIVSVSVRRIYARLSSAFPRQALFRLALTRLAVPSG